MLLPLTSMLGSDTGVTAIEYAFIAALVALALFTVVGTLGGSVSSSFNSLSSGF
jgi:pilus assembly protein Flp/PilA